MSRSPQKRSGPDRRLVAAWAADGGGQLLQMLEAEEPGKRATPVPARPDPKLRPGGRNAAEGIPTRFNEDSGAVGEGSRTAAALATT